MKPDPLGASAPDFCRRGVVVVRLTESGWRFLMLRAYRNWDFPKGLVEMRRRSRSAPPSAKSPKKPSISDLAFTWGQVYFETAPYSRNKVARYYVAQTNSEAVTLPGAARARSPRASRMPLARLRRSAGAVLAARGAGVEVGCAHAGRAAGARRDRLTPVVSTVRYIPAISLPPKAKSGPKAALCLALRKRLSGIRSALRATAAIGQNAHHAEAREHQRSPRPAPAPSRPERARSASPCST